MCTHRAAAETSSTDMYNFSLFFLAIKEERFRFGNGYDQVEDVIGVAQPVRFNSKHHTFILVDYIVVDSAL